MHNLFIHIRELYRITTLFFYLARWRTIILFLLYVYIEGILIYNKEKAR
jgi:hypothetical protein